MPTTAPKLLEKRSKQLLVMPVDSHRGDGPIASTRLLYKPVENGDSWSSIIGERREDIRSEKQQQRDYPHFYCDAQQLQEQLLFHHSVSAANVLLY